MSGYDFSCDSMGSVQIATLAITGTLLLVSLYDKIMQYRGTYTITQKTGDVSTVVERRC
jgi:hypothetical protein